MRVKTLDHPVYVLGAYSIRWKACEEPQGDMGHFLDSDGEPDGVCRVNVIRQSTSETADRDSVRMDFRGNGETSWRMSMVLAPNETAGFIAMVDRALDKYDNCYVDMYVKDNEGDVVESVRMPDTVAASLAESLRYTLDEIKADERMI